MKKITIPPRYSAIINKISQTASENNFEVYAVGGFVRDLFTGRNPKDLDIMVENLSTDANPDRAGIDFSVLLSKTYGLREPVIFNRFGTAKLFIDGEEIEFIMPRKEYYDEKSRNPDTEIGSLQQDALRRDFTVNALFLRLKDMHILDLTLKGLQDIDDKIIRVTDPDNAGIIFSQDPLRILRAVRQSLQLGFKIEPVTFAAMKEAACRIHIIAPERIRDEISKILSEQTPSSAFNMMNEISLLKEIFPELDRLKNLEQPSRYHAHDVFIHTLNVVDRIPCSPVLRMAALLHDTGKYAAFKNENGKISFHGHEAESAKEADKILKRLKYPKDFTASVVSVVKNHMYPKMYESSWSDSALRKFAKTCGKELDLILEFAKADYGREKADDKIFELSERIEKLKKENMLYPRGDLLGGRDILEHFNVPKGPWIQKAKNAVYERQLENPGLTKEEAFEIVKEMLNKEKPVI